MIDILLAIHLFEYC